MSVVTVSATSTARDVAARRTRKAFRPLIVLVIIVVAVWLLSLLLPTGDTEDFGPNNPRPTGARAVGQVLGNNGVKIRYATTLPQALDTAVPGSTVLVYSTSLDFAPEQVQTLLNTGADIVLVSPTPAMLEGADLSIEHGPYLQDSGPIPAQCEAPGAVAAQEITSNGGGYVLKDDHVLKDGEQVLDLSRCFGADDSFHFAQVVRADQVISVFDDADAWSNRRILSAGNAALALHTLGRHDTLTWFAPTRIPLALEGDGIVLPKEFAIATAILGIAVTLLILSSIRRFGPVVTERLPVVVQASETTRGRGRLYRSARASGRAGAALRAATAARLAQRLGVPRSGARESLITAIAGATPHSPVYLEALFYGPAPTTDAELVALAHSLSALESEITQ